MRVGIKAAAVSLRSAATSETQQLYSSRLFSDRDSAACVILISTRSSYSASTSATSERLVWCDIVHDGDNVDDGGVELKCVSMV